MWVPGVCVGSEGSLGAATATLRQSRKNRRVPSPGHSLRHAGPMRGLTAHLPLTHEPEENPFLPSSHLHPTCFQNLLEATDRKESSNSHPLFSQGRLETLVTAATQQLGSIPPQPSLADVICPTLCCRPCPCYFFPRHLQSLPMVILRPIFPKHNLHQVSYSAHKPKRVPYSLHQLQPLVQARLLRTSVIQDSSPQPFGHQGPVLL